MAVTAVDLSPLCLPPSVTEPQDKAQAYQMLLQEGGLLYYAGKATPALLKLLFQTVTTPGLASLTQQVMWLGGRGTMRCVWVSSVRARACVSMRLAKYASMA